MSQNILVCVAWPYANGSIHIGQVAGCYLPADIFARFHRLIGNKVLMVSGSDAHGTPVTITAENRNVTPNEVVEEYQAEFLADWEGLGISFDLFTSTHTDNHVAVTQDIFSTLHDSGYIYKDTMSLPFCEDHDRFLADRYVEGICPNCNFDGARGDQCDGCGNTLDPKDLINIKHRDCDKTPVFRDTEHFFLKLSAFNQDLIEWVNLQEHWKPNVKNFTTSFLESGLKDRAITRDISWGVPVPLDGYESKRIYVWFEAVIGYLSASKEWANSSNASWEEFWFGESQSFYFMGKDNIPFHTVIWPAMLMGYGDHNLPYNVPANEYVNMEQKKISTSRNWVINLNDYLTRFDPDPLRYALSAIMPESSDSNFSWDEFVRRNNDELVATFGNLVNRVLSMTNRYFDGVVPAASQSDKNSRELIIEAKNTLDHVAKELSECKFRNALNASMSLAQGTNKYLNDEEPWKKMKTDPVEAGQVLNTCLNVINCLKICFHPFLPFSTVKINEMLGVKTSIPDNGWNWNEYELAEGHRIGSIAPLFTKLDDDVAAEESSRLGT